MTMSAQPRALSPAMRSSSQRVLAAPSEEVGSSKMITRGSKASAFRISTTCCSSRDRSLTQRLVSMETP